MYFPVNRRACGPLEREGAVVRAKLIAMWGVWITMVTLTIGLVCQRSRFASEE
jgi:hypothetical protein